MSSEHCPLRKRAQKMQKKCILNQHTFLVLFMKVFQIAGLGWLGGSGLATLQGPGLPHPAFSRSRSSRSRSSIDILPSSNGPQSSVEQAFRWRIIIINIFWLMITVITPVLVIASLAGEVSHLLEEFTIELTIMPGLTHILLFFIHFIYSYHICLINIFLFQHWKNMVQMVFTGAATVQAALEFMTPGGRLIK